MVDSTKASGSISQKRKCDLNDYEMTTTLGTGKTSSHLLDSNDIFCVGSFGRVLLAKNKKSGEFFAMKRLTKNDIIKLR
jgi:hypothetical protein